MFHFTVEVTDFERSLDFYTTLGFRVLRDNRDVVWPRMVARNFGMSAAQGRGALLGIGDGPEPHPPRSDPVARTATRAIARRPASSSVCRV